MSSKSKHLILIVTQAVDEEDPILGFFVGWIKALAERFPRVSVLCLRKGAATLPENVSLHSLGKERDTEYAIRNTLLRKLRYLLNFYQFIWRTRTRYEVVFVHMNPEYMILGGILWRLMGKKILFWYNHERGGVLLRVAMFFSHRVLHTSPYSASAGTRKSRQMPVGVDTGLFKDSEPRRREGGPRVLSLGRIAPIKGIDVIVEAVKRLLVDGASIHLTVVGDALPKDFAYRDKLLSWRHTEPLSGNFVMLPAEPSQKLVAQFYRSSDIFVNASPAGLFDKTVFEAMTCGAIPVVSSPAFKGILPPECFFKEGDAVDLARTIKKVLSLPEEKRHTLQALLREYVVREHSLGRLVRELEKVMGGERVFYVANARVPSEKAHGIQMAKMCEALVEAGIDLTVLAPRRGKAKSMRAFYSLRREVPVVRLPVLPLWNFGEVGYRLSALSFVAVAALHLFLEKICGVKARVHLVDMDQVSLAVAPLSPFPVTLEVHDAKPKTAWFSWIFRSADTVLTINGIIKEKIAERFTVPPERILVFPNGIDLELFGKHLSKEEARKRLGLPVKGMLVAYTGQLYGWKGLEIFPPTARALPEIYFYIVGGTRVEFEKVTGVLNLPANLCFAGKRTFTEIPLWLAAADLAVVLGTKREEYSFYHTSPMKLFEYMAAGCPIVAADTPAIRQVVSEREVAFYKPDSAEDLAEKIASMTRKGEGKVSEKASVAREKVKQFSWKRRAETVVAWWNQQRV